MPLHDVRAVPDRVAGRLAMPRKRERGHAAILIALVVLVTAVTLAWLGIR